MECKEVYDILSMYKNIQLTYKNIKNKSDINLKKITFRGFDPNTKNEKSQYLCAEKFIKSYAEFKDLEHRENSHYPMKDHYKKMLSRYNQFQIQNGIMSRANLIELLDLVFLSSSD